MSCLATHTHTQKSRACSSAHVQRLFFFFFCHMQCTLTLIKGIESAHWQHVRFWRRGGQERISKGDPRSRPFPPLFRLSCGATYDPSAGRMQCLGTPTELYTSIRQGPGKKTRADGKPEEGEYKEKQQLVTRTHSITLTVHLQPLYVCVCVCVCVCVYSGERLFLQRTTAQHSPHTQHRWSKQKPVKCCPESNIPALRVV